MARFLRVGRQPLGPSRGESDEYHTPVVVDLNAGDLCQIEARVFEMVPYASSTANAQEMFRVRPVFTTGRIRAPLEDHRPRFLAS
jgi:hypothetical protein